MNMKNMSYKPVFVAVASAILMAAPLTAYAYGGGGGGVIPIFINTPTPTPTPSATPTPAQILSYSETANPGDGVSHLADRALDEYLSQHSGQQLSVAQRFYVVDHLWRGALAAIANPAFVLHPGAVISFSAADIERFIAESQTGITSTAGGVGGFNPDTGGGTGGTSGSNPADSLDNQGLSGLDDSITPTPTATASFSTSSQEQLAALGGGFLGLSLPWWILIVILLLLLGWFWRQRK